VEGSESQGSLPSRNGYSVTSLITSFLSAFLLLFWSFYWLRIPYLNACDLKGSKFSFPVFGRCTAFTG
jgi:hypothetical protein